MLRNSTAVFMVKVLGTQTNSGPRQMAEEGQGLEEPPEVVEKGMSDLSQAQLDVPMPRTPSGSGCFRQRGMRKGNITFEQREINGGLPLQADFSS